MIIYYLAKKNELNEEKLEQNNMKRNYSPFNEWKKYKCLVAIFCLSAMFFFNFKNLESLLKIICVKSTKFLLSYYYYTFCDTCCDVYINVTNIIKKHFVITNT